MCDIADIALNPMAHLEWKTPWEILCTMYILLAVLQIRIWIRHSRKNRIRIRIRPSRKKPNPDPTLEKNPDPDPSWFAVNIYCKKSSILDWF